MAEEVLPRHPISVRTIDSLDAACQKLLDQGQEPLPSSGERERPFLIASLHRIGLQTKQLGW
jgi:hypothetical protein